MNLKAKAVLFLATGFYLGNIPFAPGTFGSLLGLPLAYFFSKFSLPWAGLGLLFFVLAAVGISHRAETVLGEKDPGCIVIDEIAGLAVTLLGLPLNLVTAGAGFLIFRVLDITKPFPIRWLEKKLAGGIGVVVDDVAAGVIGNLVLHLGLYISGVSR